MSIARTANGRTEPLAASTRRTGLPSGQRLLIQWGLQVRPKSSFQVGANANQLLFLMWTRNRPIGMMIE